MEEAFRKYIFSADITKSLDLEGMFGVGRRIEVDIGCGMGRFILARAAAHPEVQFIGIERLKPRVEKIAKKAWRLGLTNVFIIRLEATYVLRYLLSAHSIHRFYLFFPDPWPKRRHAGHRVFNAEFRSLIWSRLVVGGDLQVATDCAEYFGDMTAQMATDMRYRKIPAVERTDAERTDFELIFLGQGLHPGAAGFQAKSEEEIGEETLVRYAEEDRERMEAFWTEEMPHAESVHIVGIGGVGMSAVAQAYLDVGAEVTGSDRLVDQGDNTPTIKALLAQGVKIYPQDGSGIGEATTKIVVSTAIESDNQDLQVAERRGLPVVHRSEAVSELVRGKRLLAVAGTSGKSTTTALIGWVFAYAGLDPVVVNGAAVVTWDLGGDRVGSVRKGEGDWCIIEADESDRSLLRFRPEIAVVTNETADHFDEEETHRLFGEFKQKVCGAVVEGLPEDFEIRESGKWKTHFKAFGREWSLPMPGEHNAWNGCQAIAAAREAGIGDETIRRAMLTFPGVERRLQRVGKTEDGCWVIDDYSHNPAKLRAAIKTSQEICESLAVLWRPHGYRPLQKMMTGLAEMFVESLRETDRLFLLPVYDVGGTADRTVKSEDLRDAIVVKAAEKEKKVLVEVMRDIAHAEGRLAVFSAIMAVGDGEGAILICGARDPALPRLAARVGRSERSE